MSSLPAGFKYTVPTGHLQPLQKSKSDQFHVIVPPTASSPIVPPPFSFSAELAVFSSNRFGRPVLTCAHGTAGGRGRLWWAVAHVGGGLVSRGWGALRGVTRLELSGPKQPGAATEPVSWRKLKRALRSSCYIQHNFCGWFAFFAVSHCSYKQFLSVTWRGKKIVWRPRWVSFQ